MRPLTKQFLGLFSLDLFFLAIVCYMFIPAMVAIGNIGGIIASSLCALIVVADLIWGIVKFRRFSH